MDDLNIKVGCSDSTREVVDRNENCGTLPVQLDTHSYLEMRVAELWKKLEETNENLNSCDGMLETYCKVVTEKLNKNICSRCQMKYFYDEEFERHIKNVASENECNAATLMEKLTKSFQNVQSTFYSVNVAETRGITTEFLLPESQKNSYETDSMNKFCALLAEVFNKMMLLEACLEELKLERLNEPLEKPRHANSGTRSTMEMEHIIKSTISMPEMEDQKSGGTAVGAKDEATSNHVDTGLATKSSVEISEMDDRQEVGTEMEVKNEATSTHTGLVLILSALAIGIFAAEEESNEKQHKREIFGHNTGYPFGQFPYGFGFGNEGHFGGFDLGFGHGSGYGASLARVASLAPQVSLAPTTRTIGHAPAIHVTHLLSAPIHAPTLSLAAPLAAHVPSVPVKPIIAAPITSVVPVPFGLPYPTAIVATKIPASVHIAEPIRAHIAPALSAPITTVKLEVPKYPTHTIVRPSYHHHRGY
ncbi:uncharacterized protein LOC124154278 [Ischnura elegans]|uniref:uncharacterized protein LOC124154278 n=1 Tax=Ischnura elegans TaxID=197161 RepID=UPI001ED8A407|nr:uncharacterized protein LOC124154278 [Ischnura elegans]